MNTEKLDASRRVAIPMGHLPIFRTQIAIESGVERRLLFKTWGGIGDQICAEPTLRYALKMFKDCEISLASEIPELFRHLTFKKVYNLKEETPNYNRFFCFETITPPDESNLVWQFFSHMLTNCVDFPSMCALRQQLPVEDKEIILRPPLLTRNIPGLVISEADKYVLVHAGKHWQSKTFPKTFWDRVLAGLQVRGIKPVLIGADTDDNRGTVDVNAEGCLDLRNKLTIAESIWLCQKAKVLITNDSSPMHMAASGDAWIFYFASCKHPDLITHWRNGQWQWREENLSLGGIWDHVSYCPNQAQEVSAEFVPPEMLASWLPDPSSVCDRVRKAMDETN
tara:strand:- start:372 stop:1385 length:1014 start_codon:yes stop_codon:yes gene_type:complete